MHSNLNTKKILVIEDEFSIQVILRTYLENAGYFVVCADSGRDGLTLFDQHQPSLVILDLNLPEMDGLEVATRLRQKSDVYIMMLTARVEEEDRIAGLNLGADDYLTKPFSPREVVARVAAILRRQRNSEATDNILRFQKITINVDAYEVHVKSSKVDLTPTEFKLIYELAKHAGRVMSRDQLLRRVWGENFYGNDRVVDVYIGQVRRKLHELTGEDLFETVRGVGYKFIDTKAS